MSTAILQEASAPAKKKKAATAADLIVTRIRRGAPRKEGTGIVEVVRGSEAIKDNVKYVIATGIDPYDSLVGGFPMSRIVEIYGLPSCGKTSLCQHVAFRFVDKIGIKARASNSRHSYDLEDVDPESYDVTVLYIDNEHSLDNPGRTLPDNFLITQCGTIEQVFKAMDDAIQAIKEVEETTKRPQFLLVVIDTIAATASKEELAKDWGKDDYNRQPKQLREGFRSLIQHIANNNVCILCTNQVSQKFGAEAPYGWPKNIPHPGMFSASGGLAIGYWSSFRTMLHQMPINYRLVKGAKFQAGYVIHFYAEKNRLKKPQRFGKMVLLFDDEKGGWRNDFSILETLKQLGFAEEDSEGTIVFKFRRNGVKMTTFEDLGKTLDEQDENPGKGKYKDPRVSSRAAWPKFYLDHKADFDLLWDAAVAFAEKTEGIDGEPTATEEEGAEEQEQEVDVPRKRAGRNKNLIEALQKELS